MFFLVRCTFWLTIVFHAMTWPVGTWPAQIWPSSNAPAKAASSQTTGTSEAMLKMASDAASSFATLAGSTVTAKLEQECTKAPADCLALAAQLPQIVATTPAADIPAVLPPKRPMRLAESNGANPAAKHKELSQHN